jgi:signal transduction histidine kinase
LIAMQALVGVLGGVVVAGLTTVLVVLWAQRQEAGRQVDTVVATRGTAAAPAGSWLVVEHPDGRREAVGEVPAGVNLAQQRATATSAGSAGATGETYAGGREYLTRTVLRDGTLVVAGVDVSAQEDERNRLLAGFLGSTVLAGAIAAWLGSRLARRAVGPWDEALARQERFVSDASHELRTPLSRIALRARLLDAGLRAGTSRDSLVEDARLLSEEATVMGDLVDDLLYAASLDARPDVGELVDIGDVAREVVALEQVRAAERGLRLSLRAGDVPAVWGVEGALRRAVGALVDNALRHAEQEVSVVVEPHDPEQVRVRVSDDGPGIPAEQAQHLFDRFYRGADDGRGFGLGLALVRDVVDNHGGSVDVQPLAHGSCFTVVLPARDAGG